MKGKKERKIHETKKIEIIKEKKDNILEKEKFGFKILKIASIIFVSIFILIIIFLLKNFN